MSTDPSANCANRPVAEAASCNDFPIEGTVHNRPPPWTPNPLINKHFMPKVHESGTPPSKNFFFRSWLGAPAEVPEGRRRAGVFSDLLISTRLYDIRLR